MLQASRLPHNLQGVVLFQTAELLYFIRIFIRKYSIAHFFDKYNISLAVKKKSHILHILRQAEAHNLHLALCELP